MAGGTNHFIAFRSDFPIRQRYRVTTCTRVRSFIRKFWVFKMFFQMRTVVKLDRIPVEIRIFFRKFRVPVLEALKLVFMAGVALLRGQRSRAHGWATMFPMAHDALRLPLVSAFLEGSVMRRRRRTVEFMTCLAGLRQRIWRPRGANPCRRIATMRRMAGRTAFFAGELRMPTGQRAWAERADRARAPVPPR